MITTMYIYILDAHRQLTLWSVVGSGQNSNPFKLFIHVLVTCKNEEDPFKLKALENSQHFFYCKSIGIFPDV